MRQSVVDIFAVLGASASVISAVFVVIKALPPHWVEDTVLEKIQISTADVIAPSGYSVIPTNLEVIKENSKFARPVGGSALLTKSKQVPFSVYQEHRGTVGVYIDGKRDGMKVGWKLPVPKTDCSIWLYNIENTSGSFSFELRCSE